MTKVDATSKDHLLELPAELSAKARAVVERARALVESRKGQGADREEGMRSFGQNFSEITEAL